MKQMVLRSTIDDGQRYQQSKRTFTDGGHVVAIVVAGRVLYGNCTARDLVFRTRSIYDATELQESSVVSRFPALKLAYRRPISYHGHNRFQQLSKMVLLSAAGAGPGCQ